MSQERHGQYATLRFKTLDSPSIRRRSRLRSTVGWHKGSAGYEGMVYDSEGQLLTATLMDYALPRAEMVRAIETVLVEVPSEHGAYGAKGIGEPPAIPGAATVANAIRDLTGRRILSIPIRPETLATALWDESMSTMSAAD